MNSSFVIRHSSLRFLRACAWETLPVLLILYPLLLLLDDLEPGIVRSVLNPHWLLLAIVGLGTLSARDEVAHDQLSPWAIALVAVLGAAVGGFWVWWRIHAGLLGIVIGMLTATAVFSMAWTALSGEHSLHAGDDV